MRATNAPAAVPQFFTTVLQQVCHFMVDVIAADAQRCSIQVLPMSRVHDLYASSVAVTLREMQREVNTGHPFDSRLHIDDYRNDHFSQFNTAGDFDCCFMAIV